MIDTAAAMTILNETELRSRGVTFGPPISRHRMRGVGGIEHSEAHRFAFVAIRPDVSIRGFVAHVGPASYGRDLGGLLGLDFLNETGALINLRDWTISFGPAAVQSLQ